MKGTKEQKGITLIALIITIVVLLILAVVAISAITENEMLNYANNAATAYNQAQKDEADTIDNYLDYLDKYMPGGSPGGSGALTAPTSIEGVSISGNNFTVKAVGGEGATGYKYSKDGTNWSTTVASGTNYTFEDLFKNGYNWTVYARAVNASGESTSTSLSIIRFDHRNSSKYYAKAGTTWADFIENSYAGQTHTFGNYDYAEGYVGSTGVGSESYDETVCYCGPLGSTAYCEDDSDDTVEHSARLTESIECAHYHFH